MVDRELSSTEASALAADAFSRSVSKSTTRYAVQLIATKEWWMGGHGWAVEKYYAQTFPSAAEANLAAIRELPDPASAWEVVAV